MSAPYTFRRYKTGMNPTDQAAGTNGMGWGPVVNLPGVGGGRPWAVRLYRYALNMSIFRTAGAGVGALSPCLCWVCDSLVGALQGTFVDYIETDQLLHTFGTGWEQFSWEHDYGDGKLCYIPDDAAAPVNCVPVYSIGLVDRSGSPAGTWPNVTARIEIQYSIELDYRKVPAIVQQQVP